MMKHRALLLSATLALAAAVGMVGVASSEPVSSVVIGPAMTTADVATLRAAAARNDMQAQYDLGVALACGYGVARNRPEAASWFRKAAVQGHAQAQSVLGWMYMTGSGVRRDDAQALRWLRGAAEQGDTPAQNNLGIVYAQGRGVPVDRTEAEKWFRRAAEQGAADAARNLESLRRGRAGNAGPSAIPPLDPA